MKFYATNNSCFSLIFIESQYYINNIRDFVDEEGIFKALQYRYTYWPQPENATMMRQELVDVK